MKKLWFLAILMIGSCLVACVNDDDEVKESDGDPVFVKKRLVREVSPGDSVSLTSALPFMMLDVYTMDEDRIDGVRLLPPATVTNDMKYKGVFSAQEARLHWLTLYHRSARSLEVKIDPAARDSVSEVWLYAIPLQSLYTTGSRISFQLKKKK